MFKKYVYYVVVALSVVSAGVGFYFYGESKYEAGQFNAAEQLFRYCYNHGGILTHPSGERIGCMAVVENPMGT